jgi:hypothetical protein
VEGDVGRNVGDEVKLERCVGEVVKRGFTPLNFAFKTVTKVDHVVNTEGRIATSGLPTVRVTRQGNNRGVSYRASHNQSPVRATAPPKIHTTLEKIQTTSTLCPYLSLMHNQSIEEKYRYKWAVMLKRVCIRTVANT